MELTITQALQQGIAAHKEGKLQEAERFYRAILQSQPAHPDANHNLGVIAVSLNKAEAALPLFKAALEANPKVEQFWLSCIDALIKEKQFDNAKQVLEQAKKQGVARDKVDAIETQIKTTQVNEPKLVVQKESLTLSEKRKKLAQQKKQKKAKKQNLKAISPSQEQVSSLLEHYQSEQFSEAEKLAVSITQEFPKYQFGWIVLGAVLKQTGRISESLTSIQQSVKVAPHDAEARYELASTLQELGRLEEAEASYRQAIVLKSNFPKAHSNLGAMLQILGRLEEAEVNYKQAIALKPDLAEAHNNLGSTLQKLGRLDEAEASCRQAIGLKSDSAEPHNNLGNALHELGRLDEAEASYKKAITLKADFAEAHNNLGGTLKELGRLDEAEASYRQAVVLKPDYPSAKHMLAAFTGETTATAPRDYVERLFDNYAAKFENSLVVNLEYKIPRLITEMIIKDSKFDLLGSIMDLGCGTGLVGMEIKQFCEHLEGIDLSEKMLDKAKEKGVYNKLIKRDIVDYLSNVSMNFDYFISTDVFIYIGDLSDVFQLIKSRNKTGGKLAFSTEDYDGDGFFLEKSGRYSHSKTYIQSLCEKFNYTLAHFEIVNLRKGKGGYLIGGLYLLDF
jgi:predicted TPR repeat methyltransferase/thioredoxin-like negative regulator of GroEL